MTRHHTSTPLSPKTTVPAVEGSPREVADRGADTLEGFRLRILDFADEAKERAEALAERAKDLVATRPLSAVALAFGAGYVAMRIATSKLTQLAVVGGLLYSAGGALRK